MINHSKYRRWQVDRISQKWDQSCFMTMTQITTDSLIMKNLRRFFKICSRKLTKTTLLRMKKSRRCLAHAMKTQTKNQPRENFIRHQSFSQSLFILILSLSHDCFITESIWMIECNFLKSQFTEVVINSLNILDRMVSKSDIQEMAGKLFNDYDTDDSNGLDIKEFKVVLTHLFKQVDAHYVITEDKMNKMFSICDTNSDKKLSRKEFCKAVELFLEPVYIDPIPKN